MYSYDFADFFPGYICKVIFLASGIAPAETCWKSQSKRFRISPGSPGSDQRTLVSSLNILPSPLFI